MCCPFQREALVEVEGSSENSIRISVSGAPNCSQERLVLSGGESKYVPVNLLDAGPFISSAVQVVVRNNRTRKILHTYPPLPHSLAQYKEIRLRVSAPFTIDFDYAPAGFWFTFLALFSFVYRTKKANRRPPTSDDIEAPLPSPSERKHKDSSILDSTVHNVYRQNDEEIDDKSSGSDAHCIEVVIDDPYNTENSSDFNTEVSSFTSCSSSPSDYLTPKEEIVCQLEAKSSSFIGSILHVSKKFMGVINYIK